MPDTGIHRAINGSKEEPALPFEGLVDLLRREGFGTRPDDYMELLRVSQTFGSGDLQQLRYRLAPLVATTEQEQQKFYAIFDQYERESRNTDNEARNIQRKKKKRRAANIALICLLAIAGAVLFWKYYLVIPPTPSPFFGITVNGNNSEVALAADTIVADAREYLAALGKDSANTRISWNAGGEWIEGVNKYSFIAPASTGSLPIMMKVETGQASVDTTVTRNIMICSSIIDELRMENGTELQPGETLIVSPTVRGNMQAIASAKWVINDTDTIENIPATLRYRVDTAGTYNINYITASNSGACNQFTPLSVFVQKAAGSTRLEAGTPGEPVEPATTYRSWLYALLLIPVIGTIITAYRHRQALNKLLQKKQEAVPGKDERSLKHIDIPLVNKDVELVARETGFNSLFTGMRKKIEDDTLVLDINKSIRAEIMAAGMPTLVFTKRLRQQEFVILIDRTRNSGQQWHLFEYLVKVFAEENIRIERFFYTSLDKFYNEEFKEGISLQRLADLYKGHVLLVFGNGYQWLHPHIAAVDKEKTRVLFEWEFRTLITPVPHSEWAAREEALKKVAVLLPADIKGQLLLVQAIHEKQFDLESTLRALPSQYEIADWQSQDPAEIREYLGEEVLFQWLCAVAVYPKLRWEMIVETGKAICESAGRPELMNFSNLLKLVRIPWMQDGAIPEQTRLRLLKALSVPNEITARETILRLLNDPALNTDDDFFFRQEKQQQELTNRFVLFAHDRDRFQAYEKEFTTFSNSWKNGKVYDAALLRYLDKQPGDHWETPLQNLSNGNLSDVLKTGAKRSVQSISGHYKKLYWYNAAALAALAIFLVAGKPVAETIDPSYKVLVKADSSRLQQLNFVFVPDSCVAVEQNFSAGLKGVVRTASAAFPLEFSDARTAKVTAPYREITGGAVVELIWDNGTQTADERLMLSKNNEFTVNGCASISRNKPRLEINYNDPLKTDTVRQIADLLSSRFDVRYKVDESLSGPSSLIVPISIAPVEDPLEEQLLSIFNRKIEFVKETTGGNDSVSTLNLLFDKIQQWEMIKIPQLPNQLVEIWRGTTNGRLLTINITDRVAWYSTGDPATYGTYRIEEAYRKENILRLVLSGSNRFRVAFLQNVRAGRFQFCLLPQVFDSRQEAAAMDITECSKMEMMTEYYPSSAAAIRNASSRKLPSANVRDHRKVPVLPIYFPLKPQLLSLTSAESNRLINNDRTYGQYAESSIAYYRNGFFTEFKSLTANATQRGEVVRKLLETQPAAPAGVVVNTFSGTPFDRDYVSVSWEEPSDYQQENAPVTQQQAQQQVQQEAPVEWQFITRLELNQKGFDIRNPDEVLFKQLYGQLSSKEDARLMIVGYYRTAEDRKEAEYMTNEVARQLERYGISAKLGNNKVSTSVREFTGTGINRVIRSNNNNTQEKTNPFVDLYGIKIAMPASKY